jgi:vancomycin permeability regulator SanA
MKLLYGFLKSEINQPVRFMKTENRKILLAEVTLLMLIAVLNSCAFSTKTCKNLLEKSFKDNYDIVIVPGVPLENGKWSPTMKARVYWSKYLYDKGITKNIIYSGSAVYSPYYEGEIMALYAEKLGIPKEHIFSEIRAEHSTENVYYSYKMARKMGFSRIALASDPFQTKMLRRFTRIKVSRYVGFIPIVTDTLKAIESSMIDPEIDYQKAFVTNFKSLPERENFLRRVKGTRGLDIDTTAYR